MKKELTTLLLMLTMGIGNMMAQSPSANLYIPDVNVDKGTTTVTLEVCMVNTANTADCFSGNVYVPDGFTVTSVTRGSRITGREDPDDEESEYLFTFSKSQKNGGQYFQCYTDKGATIPGTDGAVAKVKVSIPSDAAAGCYDIVMREVECGMPGVVLSSYSEYTSKLTIGDNGEVTFNADGYATYSSAYERTVPSGVTAYTGAVDEDAKTITWTAIADGIIPANEGVLLKGTAGASVTLASSDTDKAKIAGNNMKPNLKERTKSEIGQYIYVLKGAAIMRLAEEGTLAAYKAYFNLSKYITDASSAANSLSFIWDDATSINSVENEGAKRAYNINGQRVNAYSKGIVIVNGVKTYNK